MTDPTGQPWNGVYNGFSAAAARPHAPSRGLPIPRAVTIGAGVGGALVLGLLVGLFAKPDLGESADRKPMHAVTPSTSIMPVVVNRQTAVAPPLPQPVGKLEVLPPDMARAAQRQAVTIAPTPASAYVPTPERLAPSQPLPVSQPAPQTLAGDPACAGARGRAAQLVCGDPELASADRELNRAYRRALRSGASPDELRAEQRDWLRSREDVARRSPGAVVDLYRERIEELDQLADDGPN